MIMPIKINKEILMSLPQRPCDSGIEWYEKHGSDDLLKTLIDLNEYYPPWARWLFTRMMNKKQCVEIAVFAAELVLPTYEKNTNDKRSRDAIEAAKRYLKAGTADASAAASAYAVADAAAVYVAAAASYAADASAAAAYDADCAAAASACATSADAAYAAAATVASAAAYAAAAAADAAASACATGAAADYAAAAAGAASVAAAAASAASAADVAENKKQTELQIINEAARILERDNA
jgi:hypothetical protein